jgi:hypothetical protein
MMIPMRWMTNDDNAASETLGYILIFMIVLTCIAIILFAGNGVLDTAKSQNNFKNMEQGFTVLCSDLKQVALEGTPVKTTRIHMEGGAASAKANTNELIVTFEGTERYHQDIGNIMFKSDRDDSIVSLENGGLWEKQGMNSGDIVVLEPRIYKTTDPDTNKETLVLNIINLDANPESAVGGSTTMDVMLTDEGTSVLSYDASPGQDVVITFYTNYPGAWERFYQKNGAATVSYSDRVTATFPSISKLIISEHTVGATMS